MSSTLITNSFKAVKRSTRSSDKKQVDDPQPSTSKAEDEMAILKHFDVTLEFGPCTGITRMERWERAEKHGLNPPMVVKEILLKYPHDEDYTECLWKDYPL